jgi:uncharacterized protein (UPF0548 family)
MRITPRSRERSARHARLWESKKVTATAATRHRKPWKIEETSVASFDRAWDAVRRYDIFDPRHVVPFLPAGRPVEVGDTVVLYAPLVPGLAIEMGDRALEISYDKRADLRSAKLTVGTLDGHVEKGVETFEVEERSQGDAVFRIRSWSIPAAWYLVPGAPVVHWSANRARRGALRHVQEIAGPGRSKRESDARTGRSESAS